MGLEEWIALLEEYVVRACAKLRPSIDVRGVKTAISSNNSNFAEIGKKGDLFEIRIDMGCLLFANLLSKCVAQCIPIRYSTGDKLIINRRNNESLLPENVNILAISRLDDLLSAYLIKGDIALAAPYEINHECAKATEYLLNAMELFILSHEYAHLLNGDFDTVARSPNLANYENVPCHQIEFEADMLGIQLSIEAMRLKYGKDFRVDYIYWGAELFLLGLGLLEKAISLGITGSESKLEFPSHPSALDRISSLRKNLSTVIDPFEMPKTIKLAEILGETVDKMWQMVRWRFEQIHLGMGWPNNQWKTWFNEATIINY